MILKLVTKGEIGKETPFYSGSNKTYIIEEFISGEEVYNANILYEEK